MNLEIVSQNLEIVNNTPLVLLFGGGGGGWEGEGGGRLFQVVANSRLSGYSNKNGIYKNHTPKNFSSFRLFLMIRPSTVSN